MSVKLRGIPADGLSGVKMRTLDPTDPYFAYVSLLLHGDGTDGSTVITDSSSYARTLTPTNTFSITTANKKIRYRFYGDSKQPSVNN